MTATRLARSPLIAPFAIRAFRFQWPADLLTSWGIEMEVPILGWFILSETGSVVLLTLYASLQYLGTLVAPLIGQAGDRFGHRNVLCLMRAGYTVCALAILLMAFTGTLSAIRVLIVSGISGMIRPSDLAMRTTLVAEMMPPERLMGAMGLSRVTSDSARVVGSLAGVSVAALLGLGPAYMVVTACYLAGLGLTSRVSAGAARAHAGHRPSFLREVAEGMRYVGRTPVLLAAVVLAFLINLTAYPTTIGLLPYVAKEIYGTGQSGLGVLVASFATGASCGSIVIGLLGPRLPAARAMLLAAIGWHLLIGVFSLTTEPVSGVIMLVIAGFVQSFCVVPLSALLMHVAEQRYRGRVMGARMLAIYGLPVGLMASGVLIRNLGFMATIIGYSLAGALALVALGLYWRQSVWPLDAAGNGGSRGLPR